MSIVKGKRAVREAIIGRNIPVEAVYCLKGNDDADLSKIQAMAEQEGIPVRILDRGSFTQRFGESGHQKIVAEVGEYRWTEFSAIKRDPEAFPVVLVLDHIEDPHNFGAILRSAEALGVSAVMFAKNRQVQITPTVAKVSAGAVAHVKLLRVSNISQQLRELDKLGFTIVGADEQGDIPFPSYSPRYPLALVLGNEGKGLSDLVKKQLHDRVAISLPGKVESLNVSVAAGILIYGVTQPIME